MKQLQLDRIHRSLGAEMVPFVGWDMPLKYTSIFEEHMAVRRSVGLFDISHMGEILVQGEPAIDFLQRLTTNDVSMLGLFGSQYSTVLNERGGIKDDIFVYRLDEEEYLVVVNAVNVEKIFDWFRHHSSGKIDIDDITLTTTMLALQGPKAEPVLQHLTDFNLRGMKRFEADLMKVADLELLVSRTGYTGEDGFELYLMDEPASNPSRAERLWNAIMEAGEISGIKPCGIGARDTTRLEAGYVLYGNELTEDITPLEARVSYAVKLEKGDFIGRGVLKEQKNVGLKRVRIGLRMLERGVPRHDYKLLREGKEVGHVTSGTMSPLLSTGIAMGYASPNLVPGDGLAVDIRGKSHAAEVVKWPFYNPDEYGFSRK
jgi:aminomethyltransferase